MRRSLAALTAVALLAGACSADPDAVPPPAASATDVGHGAARVAAELTAALRATSVAAALEFPDGERTATARALRRLADITASIWGDDAGTTSREVWGDFLADALGRAGQQEVVSSSTPVSVDRVDTSGMDATERVVATLADLNPLLDDGALRRALDRLSRSLTPFVDGPGSGNERFIELGSAADTVAAVIAAGAADQLLVTLGPLDERATRARTVTGLLADVATLTLTDASTRDRLRFVTSLEPAVALTPTAAAAVADLVAAVLGVDHPASATDPSTTAEPPETGAPADGETAARPEVDVVARALTTIADETDSDRDELAVSFGHYRDAVASAPDAVADLVTAVLAAGDVGAVVGSATTGAAPTTSTDGTGSTPVTG